MNISFVVIGLNEGLSLISCLESIYTAISHSQCISKFEVLYVDSGSVDDSLEAVKQFDDIFTYSLQADKSAAAARKVGELNSKLDYVLFLDGDMILDDTFIDTIFSHNYINGNIVGCIGMRAEYLSSNNKTVLVNENYYNQKGVSNLTHIGGALFIKRQALLSSGGFLPSQKMWEEQLLLSKINGKGLQIIGIEVPFIAHMNKNTPSTVKSLLSYLKPNGTGFYYIMYLFNSIKGGVFFQLIKNQKLFFCLLGLFCILLPFLLFLELSEYIVIPLLMILIISPIKSIINSMIRLVWLAIYPFIPKSKFIFKWRRVDEATPRNEQ